MSWLEGRCSEFGGIHDEGMKNDTGLAFYEPHEANLRPDIFLPAPADNPSQETWKRLRPDFPYIALNLPHYYERSDAQKTPFKITNPKTKQWVIAFVVDRGPGAKGRVVDLSPCIMARLRIETDDIVQVDFL